MKNHKKATAEQKQRALADWAKHGNREVAVWQLCKKHHCCRATLYNWARAYDGTIESLKNKSSRPHTPHPTTQSVAEQECIRQVLDTNPTFGYMELYGELRASFAYSRHFMTMYRYIVNHCIKPVVDCIVYIRKPYYTPSMFGQKWQIDVKEVPAECYTGKQKYWLSGKYKKKKHKLKFYQYTALDEATRERFIYAYDRHTAKNTNDFLERAFTYFGYLPKVIQTDNGKEFTNKYTDTKKEHIADKLMQGYGIDHKLIKPRTPRHNGKVERSHRTDHQFFYKYLQFSTMAELQAKMADWLVRYNKIPSSALRDKHGKQKYQTPLQKRAELLELLQEQLKGKKLVIADKPITLPNVRWLKNSTRQVA